MDSVDVLLINPTRVGYDSYLTPPMHLTYLGQALKNAGYTFQILNVHEHFCKAVGISDNTPGFHHAKHRVEQAAIQEAINSNAKLIGVGSIPSAYDFTERLVNAVKRSSNVPVILGGSLGLPMKDLWFRNTQVDYLCKGDGERVIVDLVRSLGSEEGIRKIPGLFWRAASGWEGNEPDLPVDLDYIEAPPPDMVDFDLYSQFYRTWINNTLPAHLRLGLRESVWPVIFSRGCVYNCTFCFHFSRRHRRHSIEYVVEHLRRLKNEYGITVVNTMDDLVMANPNWFMSLCAALEKAQLGIRVFTSGGKANIVTKEMAEAMARANFLRISYGIESGSQRILDEMQKNATVEDNRRAVKLTTEAGVFVHLNMVVGMPGEDRTTLAETREFLLSVVRENRLSERNVSFSFATPYPGTQLYEIAERRGKIGDMRDYIVSVRGVGDPEPVLCNVSKQELVTFVRKTTKELRDIRLKREGKHLRRLVNVFAGNPSLVRVGKVLLPGRIRARLQG